jgi:hypothetical protein
MKPKVWGAHKLLIHLNCHKDKRPMGRKRVKEQLKNKGGDDGSYKNMVQELLVEEEKKMKDLRWQEAKQFRSVGYLLRRNG